MFKGLNVKVILYVLGLALVANTVEGQGLKASISIGGQIYMLPSKPNYITGDIVIGASPFASAELARHLKSNFFIGLGTSYEQLSLLERKAADSSHPFTEYENHRYQFGKAISLYARIEKEIRLHRIFSVVPSLVFGYKQSWSEETLQEFRHVTANGSALFGGLNLGCRLAFGKSKSLFFRTGFNYIPFSVHEGQYGGHIRFVSIPIEVGFSTLMGVK